MQTWLILGISTAAVLFAIVPGKSTLNRSTGSPEAQNISNIIKESAQAFLAGQNKIIGTLVTAAGALSFCALRL